MKPTTVDEYIAAAPLAAQPKARQLRLLIKKTAPKAQEKLSYGIPYYSYKGRLVYWSAQKDYLGLYVMRAARESLAEQMKPYRAKSTKATLHFPLDKSLPVRLITAIVKVEQAAKDK